MFYIWVYLCGAHISLVICLHNFCSVVRMMLPYAVICLHQWKIKRKTIAIVFFFFFFIFARDKQTINYAPRQFPKLQRKQRKPKLQLIIITENGKQLKHIINLNVSLRPHWTLHNRFYCIFKSWKLDAQHHELATNHKILKCLLNYH